MSLNFTDKLILHHTDPHPSQTGKWANQRVPFLYLPDKQYLYYGNPGDHHFGLVLKASQDHSDIWDTPHIDGFLKRDGTHKIFNSMVWPNAIRPHMELLKRELSEKRNSSVHAGRLSLGALEPMSEDDTDWLQSGHPWIVHNGVPYIGELGTSHGSIIEQLPDDVQNRLTPHGDYAGYIIPPNKVMFYHYPVEPEKEEVLPILEKAWNQRTATVREGTKYITTKDGTTYTDADSPRPTHSGILVDNHIDPNDVVDAGFYDKGEWISLWNYDFGNEHGRDMYKRDWSYMNKGASDEYTGPPIRTYHVDTGDQGEPAGRVPGIYDSYNNVFYHGDQGGNHFPLINEIYGEEADPEDWSSYGGEGHIPVIYFPHTDKFDWHHRIKPAIVEQMRHDMRINLGLQ